MMPVVAAPVVHYVLAVAVFGGQAAALVEAVVRAGAARVRLAGAVVLLGFHALRAGPLVVLARAGIRVAWRFAMPWQLLVATPSRIALGESQAAEGESGSRECGSDCCFLHGMLLKKPLFDWTVKPYLRL